MPTTKDVLLITYPYVVPVTMLGCCAAVTGMCLLDSGAGLWGCLVVGILIGLILSLPMVVLVALALLVVDGAIGAAEEIRDEIRWRRAESQGRC